MSINSNSVVNTTFFDSGVTAPQIVSPTSTSLVANNANALDVAATDDQWMIKQMMAKPLLLATISWTTSQTQVLLLIILMFLKRYCYLILMRLRDACGILLLFSVVTIILSF